MKPLILLTGMMATGKTVTARRLARLLGWGFVDTDTLIERSAGCSISELVQEEGMEGLRDRETELARDLANLEHQVVATGGGFILREENRNVLEDKATWVCLTAPAEVLAQRAARQGGRPYLDDVESPVDAIDSLMRRRARHYDAVPLQIDTQDKSPWDVAIEAARALGEDPISIRFPPDQHPAHPALSPVVIRPGLLDDTSAFTSCLTPGETVFVITDERVQALHGRRLDACLRSAGGRPIWFAVPAGEASKTPETLETVLDFLAAEGATRDSLLVAFGGGVVGDLAGLAASLYMRGVALLQVPTTLLAQVDAAIGGKTAVDSPRGRNLFGSFHPPLAVFTDPEVLATLPDTEYINGLGEAVKTLLLGDAEGYRALCDDPSGLTRKALPDIITRCARIKADLVGRDPFERGPRRVLNLGHTIGHALETALGPEALSHGKAVALGLLAAARISEAMGLSDEPLTEPLTHLLTAPGLPTALPDIDPDEVIETMRLDKKVRHGRIHLVLPVAPGKTVIRDDVPEKILADAVRSLQNQ